VTTTMLPIILQDLLPMAITPQDLLPTALVDR
jgi:hypothetical protein